MRKFLIVLGLFFGVFSVYAGNAETTAIQGNGENKENAGHEKKVLRPGELIIEHVSDAYYWHILTVHDKPVAIPLPVILYSKYSGFHFFFSNKFEHGHASWQGFEISEEGAHKGKIVEKVNGTDSRPFDLSITKNVLSLLMSVALLLWVFISIANRYKKNPGKAPRGLQSALEPIILFVRDDIAMPSIGKHRYEKYMPYLLSVFFFIWINNTMGLIPIFPGGANVTGNIAITLVLALFTFIITSINGNKNYWVHMVNMPGVPWWLKIPVPLMPFIEIMGMFIRPFVLMIRLFANILAGHINLLGFISLIFVFGNIHPAIGYGFSVLSVAFAIFLYFLELLVAFIQAYVFTLLSALYFGMATEEAHH